MKKILTSFACMALLVACSDKSANYDELFGEGKKSVKLTLKDGKFTDSRDGQKYSVVAIGEMIWMAENLRYADSSKTPNLKGNMWCLENEKRPYSSERRAYGTGKGVVGLSTLNHSVSS